METKKLLSDSNPNRNASAPMAQPPPLLIGTVSRLIGRAPDTIRAWEKRGEFVAAARLSNGTRLFSPDNVRRLRELAASKKPGRPPKAQKDKPRDA